MCLTDDNIDYREAEVTRRTNRELTRGTALEPVVQKLEQTLNVPYANLKQTLKDLAVDPVMKPIAQEIVGMVRDDYSDSLQKLRIKGLIDRLTSEMARAVRWNAFRNIMNQLGEVAPAIQSFSVPRYGG